MDQIFRYVECGGYAEKKTLDHDRGTWRAT